MVIPDITAATESLYDSTATIEVMTDVDDESATHQELKPLLVNDIPAVDVPCRLNVSGRSPANRRDDGTSAVGLNPVLYMAPDIVVPEGARITVKQNGRVVDTWLAGTSSVYQSHQEIALVVTKSRA